jgi:sulfatase modifying factor 1
MLECARQRESRTRHRHGDRSRVHLPVPTSAGRLLGKLLALGALAAGALAVGALALGTILQPALAGAEAEPPASMLPEIRLVRIEPGSFLMGSLESEWRGRVDEKPHRVEISQPFLLAAYEVTQRQWLAVMGMNPSYLYDCPDCPVERISWLEALEFCNLLSSLADLEPAYVIDETTIRWNRQASGYRLPTEAEWEYACRAGTRTAFYTGDCLPTDLANFMGYGVPPGCPGGLWRGQTVTVDELAANPWELHNMHGNVSEWCWDVYGEYEMAGGVSSDAVTRNQTHDQTLNLARVLRGGHFDSAADLCRSACRQSAMPERSSRALGLRPARNAN